MPGDSKAIKIKLDARVLLDLRSQNENVVLRAIQDLRAAGNVHYLPELLKLLSRTSSEPIEKELVRFLSDVKDPAAVPLILDGLRDGDLAGARESIIAACWQSGLDFSRGVELFARLFLEGDYQTALEAFTVIEESLMNLSRDAIESVRNLVKGGMDTLSEEKKPLARELIKLLQV